MQQEAPNLSFLKTIDACFANQYHQMQKTHKKIFELKTHAMTLCQAKIG